jgi:hypothetical protein
MRSSRRSPSRTPLSHAEADDDRGDLTITLGDISPACAAYCHGIHDPVHVELDHRLPDGAALSAFTSVFHSASYNEDMTCKDVGYMLRNNPQPAC